MASLNTVSLIKVITCSAETSGADPGFLKKNGALYILRCGGSLGHFYLIFIKFPMKMKQFSLRETDEFHFDRIF